MKRFQGGQNPRIAAILEAMDELGGTATSRQVHEKIRNKRFENGKRYMNQQDVSSYLSWMRKMKNPPVALASRSGTGSGKAGNWKITDSGRERLRK